MTDRPFRRGLRRPPAVHRPPALPAPETPEEVLERAPDVSRETTERDAESAAWAALERHTADAFRPGWEDRARESLDAAVAAQPPPLSRAQVLKLEALTARWTRDVRLEVPEDATLLYATPKPPPPPSRPVVLEVAPPVVDQVEDDARSAELLEEHQTPGPAPVRDPDAGAGPGPARRVSDWVSRHDPRSLEYPVRARLSRAVPLADVSLEGGPVLDQGTTPPLSVRDASACVGFACAAAANVLYSGRNRGDSRAGYGPLREDDARKLYHRAQDLDQFHGHDYAGTSVLAGLKAGQEAGLWGGYLWALGGTKDVAQVLLQLRVAVVVGVPWSTSLEDPDRYGVIRPGGSDAGGHALAVVGLKLSVGGRPGPWFELQQSRGASEGVAGRVYMHHSHLARLLGGIGEAGVPLPVELLEESR